MAVRRVRRIIRRIDPWTVLKVSLVFNAIAALVFVLGTWVLWSLSLQRGIPDRIVDIFDRITLTLAVDGELYFRLIVLLAVVGAIVLTGLFTLGAVLYNLIADLVGGVEITVLEETYNPNPEGTRTVLRPVVRTPVEATQAAEQADAEIGGAGDGTMNGGVDAPVAVPLAQDASPNGAVRGVVTGADSKSSDDDAEDIPDPVGTG